MTTNKLDRAKKHEYKIRDKTAQSLREGNFKQQVLQSGLNYERLRPQDIKREMLLEDEDELEVDNKDND